MHGINYRKMANVLRGYRSLFYTEFEGKKAVTNEYALYVLDTSEINDCIELIGLIESSEICSRNALDLNTPKAEPLERTSFIARLPQVSAVMFKRADGRIILANEAFLSPFGKDVTFWQDTENLNAAIIVRYGGEAVGAVMPMRAGSEIQAYNNKMTKAGGI